jgi:hypothetical protein
MHWIANARKLHPHHGKIDIITRRTTHQDLKLTRDPSRDSWEVYVVGYDANENRTAIPGAGTTTLLGLQCALEQLDICLKVGVDVQKKKKELEKMSQDRHQWQMFSSETRH